MKLLTLLILVGVATLSVAERRNDKYSVDDEGPNGLADSDGRKEKFFSIFTIVRFPNDACRASSGSNGTCLTSAECTGSGATASGTCASGFGVCCVFTGNCGGTTNRNCTYFQNPGYSTAYTTAGTCQFTVNKCSTDVCQLRLDFENFSITGPDATAGNPSTTYGSCATDQFLATGGPNGAFGPICGVNTGQHVYVDAANGAGPCTLNFVTGSTTTSRTWSVKITQVKCADRAPAGCDQYYTGVSGIIQSYNYQSTNQATSGVHLQNQCQVICIRPEAGFCSIQYAYNPAVDSATNPANSFGIFTDTAMMATVPTSCTADYLLIPTGTDSGGNNADRFCGEALAGVAGASMVPVTSPVRQFTATFKTDTQEVQAETNANGFRGFSLQYTQQPCTTG